VNNAAVFRIPAERELIPGRPPDITDWPLVYAAEAPLNVPPFLEGRLLLFLWQRGNENV
jgi:hypothetical protein